MNLDHYFKRETHSSKKIKKQIFDENFSKVTIFEEMVLQQ